MKKIAVVTVCFNAENEIEKTLKSVLKQSFGDFEYIIIDGESTDGTLSIIRKYKDPRIRLISEPDKGIYDAMNKAVRMAEAKYIVFMNAGDRFFDRDVLKDIVPYLKQDVVYGNAIVRDQRGWKIERYTDRPAGLFMMFLSGYMINHQAIFTKTKLLKRNPFDLSYQICADRALYAGFLKEGRSFRRMDRNIVLYDGVGGLSSVQKNQDIIRAETDRILKENFKAAYDLTIPLKVIIRRIRKK